MFSLWAQVEKQFQLCAKFLGPNAKVLGNANLPLKLKNESSSLKVYLQKSGLREKEKQNLISKIDLKEKEKQKLISKVDLKRKICMWK